MLTSNQQMIDLGKSKFGFPQSFKYTLTNTAQGTIKIKRVSVGCGSCTQASMDKGTIGVGQTATVNVVFTPNSTGVQAKSVTVDYFYEGNETDVKQIKLRFTSIVHG